MCVEVTAEELGEGGGKERPVEVVPGEMDQHVCGKSQSEPRGAGLGVGSGMAGPLAQVLCGGVSPSPGVLGTVLVYAAESSNDELSWWSSG